MSIIYSVHIYGCVEGSTGAALAMTLAGKPVQVFVCWLNLWEMSRLEDIPKILALSLNPLSDIAFQTAKEKVAVNRTVGG